MLLQQRYGNPKLDSASSSNLSRTISRTSALNESQKSIVSTQCDVVISTKEAEASRAIVGGNSIAENYVFSGVHHIFDQHSKEVTMIKFANNGRSRLCCSSLDGSLSICDVTSDPPCVLAILKGYTQAVSAFDWSANNDLIVSVSLDATINLWKVTDFTSNMPAPTTYKCPKCKGNQICPIHYVYLVKAKNIFNKRMVESIYHPIILVEQKKRGERRNNPGNA